MTVKMPPRLVSICGVLMAVCLVGAFSFIQVTSENQANGHRNDSTAYAKQITRDLSPLPNQNSRSRIVTLLRNFDLAVGIEQSMHLFLVLQGIIPLDTELLNPQSLTVSNPTIRAPPV